MPSLCFLRPPPAPATAPAPAPAPRKDDDDDASTAEILDEQEQETLITTLTTQNNARNAATHRLLYLLPTLSAIPFLLDLFLPPPTQPHRLLPLLGLSSLAATGLLLVRLRVTETGFWFLDSAASASSSGSGGGGGGGGGGDGVELLCPACPCRRHMPR